MSASQISTLNFAAYKFEEKVIALTSITFIVQIIYSSKLWTSDRVFPNIPIFALADLLGPIVSSLTFAMLFLLALNVLFQHRNLSAMICTLLVLLICNDVNRMQPWTYIYISIYFLHALNAVLKIKDLIKTCLQILIIAMFFWSGFSKLNYHFLDVTFVKILTETFRISNPDSLSKFKELGFFIPLVEMGIACSLFTRARKVGLAFAILSHLFIIYFVSPLSLANDYIVIPWNILMIILELLCFMEMDKIKISPSIPNKEKIVKYPFAILMLFLPFLNMFGKWDNFLSFNLYSDKTENLLVVIEDEYIAVLDPEIQKQFREIASAEGGKMLDLLRWSFDELKVPYYPEDWVIHKSSLHFCQYDIPDNSLYFLRLKGEFKPENITMQKCGDLQK